MGAEYLNVIRFIHHPKRVPDLTCIVQRNLSKIFAAPGEGEVTLRASQTVVTSFGVLQTIFSSFTHGWAHDQVKTEVLCFDRNRTPSSDRQILRQNWSEMHQGSGKRTMTLYTIPKIAKRNQNLSRMGRHFHTILLRRTNSSNWD